MIPYTIYCKYITQLLIKISDGENTKKYKEVDFSTLREMSDYYAIGPNELRGVFKTLEKDLNQTEIRKIPILINKLFPKNKVPMDIGKDGVEIIRKLVKEAYKKGYKFDTNLNGKWIDITKEKRGVIELCHRVDRREHRFATEMPRHD